MLVGIFCCVPVCQRTLAADDSSVSARSFDSIELAKAIRRAMRLFRTDRPTWAELQRRGMTLDFSWENAARTYIEAYNQAIQLS